MKRAWMPLYVGDYLGDTGHLTTTQHGAYLLLMMHYWRKGELPDDDRQLAKIAKLPLRHWRDCRAVLQEFFQDGWKHKRIETELQRMTRVSEKRAEAGQKGGVGSALSRMKLENAARGTSLKSLRPAPLQGQAIASICSSKTQASVDHSHPHSSQSLSEVKDEIELPAKKPARLSISRELADHIARQDAKRLR